MPNHFSENPVWTDKQNEVLNAEPNLIINGCAGSGKTFLACHLALKHSIDKRVAILVYTKSLKSFLEEYIERFGGTNISVLYQYQWQQHDYPEFDIIIVDEYQDFSDNDFTNVKTKSVIGVYIFGDDHQRIYHRNIHNHYTFKLKDFSDWPNFSRIKLTENMRISTENKRLINYLYPDNELGNPTIKNGMRPIIKRFETVEDELTWLKDYLLETEFEDIAILFKKNDSFIGAYPVHDRIVKEKVYGIFDLRQYLENNEINVGYKYKTNENLNFGGGKNINLMSIHSDKGLQHECVILPFSNYINDTTGDKNIPFVALTRATRQIIITYTGHLADEYSHLANIEPLSNNIVMYGRNLRPPQNEYDRLLFLGSHLEHNTNENEKELLKRQNGLDNCSYLKLSQFSKYKI